MEPVKGVAPRVVGEFSCLAYPRYYRELVGLQSQLDNGLLEGPQVCRNSRIPGTRRALGLRSHPSRASSSPSIVSKRYGLPSYLLMVAPKEKPVSAFISRANCDVALFSTQMVLFADLQQGQVVEPVGAGEGVDLAEVEEGDLLPAATGSRPPPSRRRTCCPSPTTTVSGRSSP